MMKIKVLNKKEIKNLLNALKRQYLIDNLKLDYIFILGSEDKVYIVDKKFAVIDVKDLRINSIGMYFCKFEGADVRLSIEGSQIGGPYAKKNVIILSEEEINNWVGGKDIVLNSKLDGFVLIRYKDDFFGSGKCVNGRLLNFTPKGRRIKSLGKI